MIGSVPGPKPRVELDEWVPRNFVEAAQLYHALLENGESSTEAGLVIDRLRRIALDGPFTAGERVRRAELVRLLTKLGEPPWKSPDQAPNLSPLSSVRAA